MVNAVLFGSFIIMLILNVPIAVALGLSAALTLLYAGVPLSIIAINIYSGQAKFLLLAIPFGILVEKVIGSRRFLVMAVAAWVVDIILIFTAAYFTTPTGEETVSCGASGLVFSFMPIGMYILFVLGKKYGFKKLLKQVSFYLLLPIAIATLVFALSPNAGGVAGIWSMIVHLLGLGCGVLFTVIYRKKIWENTSKTDMK